MPGSSPGMTRSDVPGPHRDRGVSRFSMRSLLLTYSLSGLPTSTVLPAWLPGL